MNNTQLTSRQRLNLTLNHKEPDRIPFDLGATFTTGIHMNAYQKLRNYLALPETRPDFFCFDEQIAVVEDDLADLLGVDVRPIVPGNPQAYTFMVEDRGSFFHFTSEWGVGAKMPKDGGLYYDAYINPLKDCYSISDLASYPWPDPTDPARFSGLAQKASSLASAGKGAVLNSICAGVMEIAAWLLGYERLFTALAQEKQFIEYLFSRITEIKMAYWERALAEVGDYADVVQESDDLGGQNRPLISLNMYRDILKPHHRKVFDCIHAHTNAKLFLHSCGAIRPLLPELIEIGVQIINPVQVSAANMETDALKRDFGRDLVFWGGGVDTQHVLGSGLPEDVSNETRKRIEDLAQGGGFVFAAVHNIQGNVPPENIMAFWQTMRTFGNYK